MSDDKKEDAKDLEAPPRPGEDKEAATTIRGKFGEPLPGQKDELLIISKTPPKS